MQKLFHNLFLLFHQRGKNVPTKTEYEIQNDIMLNKYNK